MTVAAPRAVELPLPQQPSRRDGAANGALFEELFLAHRARVYHVALRYGAGDIAWAEDVVQDVFVKLLDHLPELQRHDDLGGWLYTVTTRHCLNRLRRDRFVRSLPLRWLLGPESPQPTPEALFLVRSELRQVVDELAQIPPKERVVFSMVHLDHKEQQEVAVALGWSKGYVSKLLQKAEERIRRRGWRLGDE